jgi:large subunit ribosomal protein L10
MLQKKKSKMVGKKETHVSEAKKQKVKELAGQMKRKTVMVVSIKGLPSAQFQDIKKKLREKAKIQVVKKSLVDISLDHSGIKELKELVKYVDDSTAILFSDKDAFEISGILADEKSPAKAKAGQISPTDIEVKAGPTELLPGPDISALSAVGLIPKVEAGKITILKDKVIAKEGTIITPELASIMAKLDIIPFEVGIEPIAAYTDGKIYVDIKIDKEAAVLELEESFGRALPFAVEITYPAKETLDYIIGKAGIEEKAIELLIGEEKEETSTEENKEETGEMTEEEANEEKSDGKKNNTKEVSANQTEEIKPEGEPSSE